MTSFRFAICALFALSLQSCDQITTDYLKRSSSEAILPVGPVHVPSADSLDKMQLSLGISGMRGGNAPMKIRKSSFENSDTKTEFDGPSTLSISPIQVSASLSAWFADHFRTSVGLEVGSTGGAGSLEEGFRFGSTVSVEGFCGVGASFIHTRADWDQNTYQSNDDSGDPPTITNELTTSDRTDPRLFARAGVHVGMRRSGPWAEFEVLTQNLFAAPRSKTMLEVDANTLAAGWAFRTPAGALLLFGRGTDLGAGWIPSAGVQWTESVQLE